MYWVRTEIPSEGWQVFSIIEAAAAYAAIMIGHGRKDVEIRTVAS